MDSNSNSCEMYFPKLEVDSENEREMRKDPKAIWTSENTLKLIEAMEKECKELWDMKHPLYKDRVARYSKQEYLASMFGTTAEEISRKIHNLRTQLNNELRKIKRRQATSLAGGGEVSGGSGWEYFEALSFLLRAPSVSGDPLDSVDGVNLANEVSEGRNRQLRGHHIEEYTSNKMPRKKGNKEEILEKKRELERKRYAAIKSDPLRYELQRIKEREKYLRKKEMKLRMSIQDMSPGMQRLQRQKWRESNRRRRVEKRKRKEKREDESIDDDINNILSEFEVEIPKESNFFMKFEKDTLSDTFDAENLLAEFQADEEEEFGAAARVNTSRETSTPVRRPTLRVAASAPPPLPPSAHPMMWPEEATPRLRPGVNADECQIFGDFVASELRTLRSDESRKKLKRMIQKAILQIGEEEDMSING